MKRTVSFSHIKRKTSNIASSVSVPIRAVAMLLAILPLPIILASLTNVIGAGAIHLVFTPLSNIPIAIGEDHGALAFSELASHLSLVDSSIFIHFLSFSVWRNSASSLDAGSVAMGAFAGLGPVHRARRGQHFGIIESHYFTSKKFLLFIK